VYGTVQEIPTTVGNPCTEVWTLNFLEKAYTSSACITCAAECAKDMLKIERKKASSGRTLILSHCDLPSHRVSCSHTHSIFPTLVCAPHYLTHSLPPSDQTISWILCWTTFTTPLRSPHHPHLGYWLCVFT